MPIAVLKCSDLSTGNWEILVDGGGGMRANAKNSSCFSWIWSFARACQFIISSKMDDRSLAKLNICTLLKFTVLCGAESTVKIFTISISLKWEINYLLLSTWSRNLHYLQSLTPPAPVRRPSPPGSSSRTWGCSPSSATSASPPGCQLFDYRGQLLTPLNWKRKGEKSLFYQKSPIG